MLRYECTVNYSYMKNIYLVYIYENELLYLRHRLYTSLSPTVLYKEKFAMQPFHVIVKSGWP